MIVAVDYGAGNLANVLKAFRYLGEEVSASSSPTTIRQADGIILPGVGAFGSAIDELKKRPLIYAPCILSRTSRARTAKGYRV